MQITRVVFPENKRSIKCPYDMNAEGYVVHNTANKASAMAEISYMLGNNNQVSYHVAIDDYRAVESISMNRNTWNAGDGLNGKGNRKRISIEICYSTGDPVLFAKAEKLTAEYIAKGLIKHGWGIDKVSKHQDYSKKYCPHKTLDLGWERFLNMIRDNLKLFKIEPIVTVKPKPVTVKNTYIKGVYQALYNMKVRTGAGTNFRHKFKRELSRDGQKNCVFGIYGTYKKGTIFTAQTIITNLDNSVWAKTPSGFICIRDKSYEYCKKV